jgi:hypothetical protein
LKVEGRTVYASDAAYRALVSGQKYVLFLQLVPQTAAYQPIQAFTISGTKIIAAAGAMAGMVHWRDMDTATLFKLIDSGATLAAQRANCRGGATK